MKRRHPSGQRRSYNFPKVLSNITRINISNTTMNNTATQLTSSARIEKFLEKKPNESSQLCSNSVEKQLRHVIRYNNNAHRQLDMSIVDIDHEREDDTNLSNKHSNVKTRLDDFASNIICTIRNTITANSNNDDDTQDNSNRRFGLQE